MKYSHVFTILSAVYIAPHVTTTVGIGAGIYLGIFAVYHAWKES